MCNGLKHWSGLKGWLSIDWLTFEIYQIMHILNLCVTMTDVFVDVIRFLHFRGDLANFIGRHVLINATNCFCCCIDWITLKLQEGLTWYGGGVGKARSQSRSLTRAKVTQSHVKVTFKVKYKNHSEGHSFPRTFSIRDTNKRDLGAYRTDVFVHFRLYSYW